LPDVDQDQRDKVLLEELAIEAGKIGMRWFGKKPEVWMKPGDSPVSEADFAIDRFLRNELLLARPDYGWLSEETDDDLGRLDSERLFVVDPIDGTRGFINGQDQWCVSIAVVESHRPVVGVLECPALQQTIISQHDAGAWCNGERLNVGAQDTEASLRLTGPRNVQEHFHSASSRDIEKLPFVPSLAYRIAMIAMGDAELSLARASAKDWDLAAADLIAHEAGACLTDLTGDRPTYNCEDVRHGALLACSQQHHEEMLDLAKHAMDKR